MLAKHALMDLELARVEIHTDPRNEASNALRRSSAFTREGILRKRYPYTHNDLRDVLHWTLFREDIGRAARVNWARYQAFDAIDRPFTL